MTCPICLSIQIHHFADKNEYHFNRCGVCKTIFLNKLPTSSQINEYYSKQFSYRDGMVNESSIRKRSKVILKKLKLLMPQAKTICDVGSGYGFFLDEAHKDGYETQGIEPSKQLALHAKKRYGVSVFIGDLIEYSLLRERKFDVVTCIHVIEHVPKPKKFLFHLLKLVKTGGFLFLETPNSDSHLLYVEKEGYTFLIPPEHLWILSKESIKTILPFNTEIASISTYSYPEHLMGIVKKIVKNVSLQSKHDRVKQSQQIDCRAPNMCLGPLSMTRKIRKKLSYYFFDCLLASLFTGTLNQYHKGSILELWIKKK